MANCRACGGVLGRDCYNEQDCMSISHNEQQMYYQGLDHAEDYIRTLIYTLEQNKITVPSFSAEPPLIFKIESTCENQYIDDGLPW